MAAEGEQTPREEELLGVEGGGEKQPLITGEKKLLRTDSFDLETGGFKESTDHVSNQKIGWLMVMKLAFQSIGVVYGDLGTSPLYVLPAVFPDGIENEKEILGALSLIFYSITFISLVKYVFIVLAANDNGDGGTFAMYSLICRNVKVNLIPNLQPEDKKVSSYRLNAPNRFHERAFTVKSVLENSKTAKYIILFVTMLATSMIIGDGVLTPCISVLSAVEGIKEATSSLNNEMIMWISAVVLVVLFQFQSFGTDKVSFVFSPVLTLWFLLIGFTGLYNFVKYDPSVVKAMNPFYIVEYFKRSKKRAWVSLGGVFLCLTGSEALFADLGHFNVSSIRISACTLLFPSIFLAYFGQASYLQMHKNDVANAFYKSVPKPIYWPTFLLAVLASIIASQSLISASFSIVQQAMALGCFPRVKVVHTSAEFRGQVYVPEVNTFLMLACVGITLGFKDTSKIANAYGIPVACVFTITSVFLILIMVMIWKTNIFLIIVYALTIGMIEFVFLSAVLYKFVDGGYLPVIIALVLVLIMYVWNYGYRRKYIFELENKVSLSRLLEIANNPDIYRIPGLAIFYSELVHGISPIFTQYVTNVPALHSILVFVSIKFLPTSKVPMEERFLFQRVAPHNLAIFRCVVRYGYTDVTTEKNTFEMLLVDNLRNFIRENMQNYRLPELTSNGESEIMDDEEAWELALLDDALNKKDVVYLMGANEVMASKGSRFLKRFLVDYAFNWLNRCTRQADEVFMVPRRQLLKVGMTYEV